MRLDEPVSGDSSLAIGDERVRKCKVCSCYTTQRVEEYKIEYMPNDITNPRIGKYHSEWALGWYCPGCEDFTDRITIVNY